MHFCKIIPYVFSITSLLVPSLCRIEGELHLARRWVDNRQRDLEAEIRSLDEEWAFARRDLELEARSLDSIKGTLLYEALIGRALTSKNPALPAAKLPSSSGSKPNSGGNQAHVDKPNACSAKNGLKQKGKREASPGPDPYNEIHVDAGTLAKGGGFDALDTWSLKTCIGIIAVSGRKKVMAHLNGYNLETHEDWSTQLKNFKNTVAQYMKAPAKVKITASYPVPEEVVPRLRDTLTEMINGVKAAAGAIDPGHRVINRPPQQEGGGELSVDGDGQVRTERLSKVRASQAGQC